MSASPPKMALPPGLVEAFMRLCQGDFDFRLPRDRSRDEHDTAAFYFNAIAEEVQRIVVLTREEEKRLARAMGHMSDALVRVATGDLSAQVERDEDGGPLDVLAFLVNNTISELASVLKEKERRSQEDRQRLEALVEERTGELKRSEENFRRLFEVAPLALVLTRLSDNRLLAANAAASSLFAMPLAGAEGQHTPDFWVSAEDRERMLELIRKAGSVNGFVAEFCRTTGERFWAELSARFINLNGERCMIASLRDITEERAAQEKLIRLANVDSLTGTLNRRRVFELATAELERAERYGRPLCIAMLDLDYFKRVNDRFGHGVGDTTLVKFAEVVQAQCRKQDLVGRYGGEELLLVLPETTLEAARAVAERIRTNVESLRIPTADEDLLITVSIGVVARKPSETLASMVERADQALYRAKAGGRNRVIVGESSLA